MLVMIDNYDSFTYNLFQYLCEIGHEVKVFRNDEITVDEVMALNPSGIVISPGPGRPESAGISMDMIRASAGKIPLLGVCLGHQAIAQVFGGKIVQAKEIMHGKESKIEHIDEGVFKGLRSPIKVVRYHSLVAEKSTLPKCFTITATSEDGEIMGIKHNDYEIYGVQFHPESIRTVSGKRMLINMFHEC